ncbi:MULTISPECIES: hypothetical protein [unclassified Pantoea]|uniref:hypothetical protein n=1 Tax=unclassified Pantoea TaxID=2630326 RepID=UPI001231FC64|nr:MULTISPECIES: hypothetical protein [unclassified Pantoea]KAA5952051.1 hypothetical protein F3I55_18365 [Pantoea sp. VH_24]KAA5953419.1 hypothetical protein F3I53_22285 [Pantoea sp. VH_16]KAA5961639.1 hypothetical protein F3I54_19205 [Pantoea sp. VH_18]KAA5993347.1 hypothetical protein F3I46_18840 [Pantoea sp. M_1]KAA5998111.1 hypothetical protein F3I45_19485 [Pantoea sp. F_7]
MNAQAQKILLDLLQKASDGIDAAVSFSQAQIPDVVHQLLVWNFVHSLVITLIAVATIPPVVLLMRKQFRRIGDGVLGDDDCSWNRGKPRYIPTLVWDKRGELSMTIMPAGAVLVIWFMWVVSTLLDLSWLKIWIAPKLYLIEYAATLMGKS